MSARARRGTDKRTFCPARPQCGRATPLGPCRARSTGRAADRAPHPGEPRTTRTAPRSIWPRRFGFGLPAAALALAVGLGIGLATPAHAHTRSTSYSRWVLDEARGEAPVEARVQLRIPLLELTHHPPDHPWPSYLAERLTLRAAAGPCTPTPPTRAARAPEGWGVFNWTVQCPGRAGLTIESSLLTDVLSSHAHFARVDEGDRLREAVLVQAAPVWNLDALASSTSGGTSFAGWIRLGVEHILEGFDHLAFVTALVLLARSLSEVAVLVSAFTLAHSLTLALAVLGYVRPQAAAVEALIGFSIALVAAENGWLLEGGGRAIPRASTALLGLGLVLALFGYGVLSPLAWIGLIVLAACHFGWLASSRHPGRVRALVAFAFGLVHGFGFAGALMEIEMPADHLVSALFGFNVGVEFGQLAVVALLWPVLRWIERKRGALAWARVAEFASAVILGLGLYWLWVRNWA